MNGFRRTCCTMALLLAGGTTWGEEPTTDVLIEAPLTQPVPTRILLDDTNVSGTLSIVNDGNVRSDGRVEVSFTSIGEPPVGKYYIGLACDESLSEALRSQVGLGEKQGLLVTDTVENSPARAAGFQKHDIVLEAKVGEQSFGINSVKALVELVNMAETKPIAIEVLRRGKRITITVTPAEREQVALTAKYNPIQSIPNDPANPARVQELVMQLQEAVGAQPQPFVFRVAGPVVTLKMATELPENMSVTITKTGKEDARITVKKGNDSWGATEKEIDTLPAEVQGYVRGMLSGIAAPPHVMNWPGKRAHAAWTNRASAQPPTVPQPPQAVIGAGGGIIYSHPPTATNTVVVSDPFATQADSVKALQKQMEALQKEVQALRETLEKK